jgi:hypothetical protein
MGACLGESDQAGVEFGGGGMYLIILFSSSLLWAVRVESNLHIRSFRLTLDERSVLQVEGDFEGPPYQDAVWGASYPDLKCLIYRCYGTRDDPFSISKVKFQVLSHPTELGLANYASPPDLALNFFSSFSDGMAQCARVRESARVVRCAASCSVQAIECAEISSISIASSYGELVQLGLLKFSPGQSHSLTSPTPSSN